MHVRYLVDNTAKQLKHKCRFDLFLSVCETGVHFTLVKPGGPARAWFLEVTFIPPVCVCVCVHPRGYK